MFRRQYPDMSIGPGHAIEIAGASLGGEGDLVRAVREATQKSASRAGDQFVSKSLDVPSVRRASSRRRSLIADTRRRL